MPPANASQPIGYALPPRVYHPPVMYAHPGMAGPHQVWPPPPVGAYSAPSVPRPHALPPGYDPAQAHEEYMMSLAMAASVNDYQAQQQRRQQQQVEAQTRQRQAQDEKAKRAAAEARAKATEAATQLSHKYWQTGRCARCEALRGVVWWASRELSRAPP